MKISRNAPCPCGSGQKYKKCCLPKEEARDFSYRRISQTFQGLTGKLMTFAKNTLGPGALDEAIDHFLLWDESLDDPDTLDDLSPVMIPWILFNWHLTEPDIEELGFEIPLPAETTIAELHVLKRPGKIDSLESHVLESVGRPVFSFYEVTAVFPGSGFDCVDILGGSTHRVTDHSASEHLRQGVVLYCAMARIDDVEILAASSPVTFPLSWKTHVIDLRSSLAGDSGVLDPENLPAYEEEIRQVFLELYASSVNPPALTNTDGEPLALHTLQYAITGPQEAFDALCHLCVSESPEELLQTAEFSDNGDLTAVTIPWSRLETAKPGPMANTILGYIDIAAGTMNIDVNSEKRAEAIRAIIEDVMGDMAHYKATTLKPLYDPDEDTDDGEEDPLAFHNRAMQDPAFRAHMEDMFLEHWGQWIDTPVPALDGRTPREAMASSDGREKVETLIRSAETNADRDLGIQKKGIALARKELGL